MAQKQTVDGMFFNICWLTASVKPRQLRNFTWCHQVKMSLPVWVIKNRGTVLQQEYLVSLWQLVSLLSANCTKQLFSPHLIWRIFIGLSLRFKNYFGRAKPCRKLILHWNVLQEGEHSSVQDAQAAVRLYTMFRKQWEADIKYKDKKGLRIKSDANTAMSTVDSDNVEHHNVERQNVATTTTTKSKKVVAQKESRPLYTDSD